MAWMSAVSTGAEPQAEPLLFKRGEPSPGAEIALTISDIRRARRSTGLTLSEVAEGSRIPVSLLRELEWGYFPNWPADQYGRTQLVRYARAAGLDEEIVVRVVWPLLENDVRPRSARVVDGAILEDEVPEADGALNKNGTLLITDTAISEVRQERTPVRRPLLVTGAIAALLTIAMLPAIWSVNSPPPDPPALTEPLANAALATPVPPSSPAAESAARTARTDAKRSVAPRGTESPAAAPAVLHEEVGFSPAFATAGSAMFYHSARAGDSSIMRADTDPSGAVLRVTSVVNDDAQNFHARPSPDGSMIAFDSDREGERAVYVANADGRGVRRITGEGFAAVPSWSPDGRKLAFVRAEADRPKVWNLWTVDLETGETSRLTSHRYGQPWGAAWFPDGQQVAYSHEDRLIVRSLDGRSQRVYRSPRKGRLLRTPAVSPDGRWVMFQVQRDGGWLLDLTDASMQRILTDPSAEEFSWSPDGRRVAYHSRKSGSWNVWVMAPR